MIIVCKRFLMKWLISLCFEPICGAMVDRIDRRKRGKNLGLEDLGFCDFEENGTKWMRFWGF